MKVTLFMSISVNGMIARPDFREDFLSQQNWDSFLDCVRDTGALIWGRKTHEKVRAHGPRYLGQLAGTHNVVVSTRSDFAVAEPGFELAASPEDALRSVVARGATRATLSGGSVLNSAFARAGLIDEVILNVEGVAIGRGIPLFAAADVDLPLQLHEMTRIGVNLVQLRYQVRRP